MANSLLLMVSESAICADHQCSETSRKGTSYQLRNSPFWIAPRIMAAYPATMSKLESPARIIAFSSGLKRSPLPHVVARST